jgi:uncharacterized protein YecT (DUF1311 family)
LNQGYSGCDSWNEREAMRAMGRWLLAASMLAVCSFAMDGGAYAQSRKPTAQEVAAIRGCATKYQDDLDAGEENCLFKLVADPCAGPPGSKDGATVADCYDIESAIWDDLLNANYQTLLGELDADQTAKAKTMQRAWISYRDTTCGFYDDKIQGSMSLSMHAACVDRETARRAMLLAFFSRL